MKLWTIKTNECVKTLDAHQDKVWGLHGNRGDDRMVTGSADSHITVWEASVAAVVCQTVVIHQTIAVNSVFVGC